MENTLSEIHYSNGSLEYQVSFLLCLLDYSYDKRNCCEQIAKNMGSHTNV